MNLVVDPCPDANGHHTIRWADGSVVGDTERQPVATVYDQDMAYKLVAVWNNVPHPQFKHQLNCSCQGLMGPPCCPVHG